MPFVGFSFTVTMKTITALKKARTKIKISDYLPSTYADYLETFNNKVIKITPVDKGIETINVLLSTDQFAHLLGLQYCYGKQTSKMNFKGASGFELLKENSVSIEQLESNFNKNKYNKEIRGLTWKHNILPRMEWLPCFLNDLSKSSYKLCLNTSSESKMSGDYLLFKTGRDKYLILSLLKVGDKYTCESFISDSGLAYYDPDNEIEIESITVSN